MEGHNIGLIDVVTIYLYGLLSSNTHIHTHIHMQVIEGFKMHKVKPHNLYLIKLQ